MPQHVRDRLEHELRVITAQGLCDYFLIVWDICRFARSRGIMTTGRGSAGDSLVAYLLNITSADPLAHELLFERFLNPQRKQMPDIDVDFDSRRRDEVTAYVYRRYGAERVAAVCTLNTFRARSAIRDVGKALGMNEREIGILAENMPHIPACDIQEAMREFPELRDAKLDLSDKQLLIELCGQISRFPRHLSVHVGGLVIAPEPITNLISLQLASKGIVIAEFDKDDVEALGLVKMDILGLRIHTAISDCLDMVEQRTGQRICLDDIPLDDEPTFELLRSTDTVGLFQLESPGQRNLLGRAQPHEFEEVIANISLFRPGPVQSNMIAPYLRRKHGLEPVVYPHPALEPIMRRTFGVLIYQEQVLEIAAAIAGFTLGEADQLRRLMTSDRSHDEMMKLGESFIAKSVERGVELPVAEEVFRQVSGFAAYGFCKAHAACFGLVSYQTAWLKAHYPAEFIAGLLSAQPMGFYPMRTIAEEARRLGIQLLPPCVNRSEASFNAEYGGSSRALESAPTGGAPSPSLIARDLNLTGVSPSLNPFTFWRPRLNRMKVIPTTKLYEYKDGDRVRVAGIVVARARPPTRSGKTAIFICLEDELGLVDVAVFEECYQRCGRAIYASPVLFVEGKLTRQGARDLSVTAQTVIGLGSWKDFQTKEQATGGAGLRADSSTVGEVSGPTTTPTVPMPPQTGNDIHRLQNRLMEQWEPSPSPRVGDRRG